MAQAQAEVEQRRQETRGLQVVQHPSDLGEFFLSMNFYDYRKAINSSYKADSPINPENNIDPVRRLYNADRTSVNNQIQQKSSFAKIKLPIPANLNDNFRTAWEDTELGGFAGIASDAYQASGALMNQDGTATDQAAGLLRSAFSGELKNVARQLVGNDTLPGKLFDIFTGTAINQNISVLFRGPTLKSHSFKWRFAPKSAQETQNIQTIIAILKRAQHASQISSLSSSVLRYPSECLLQFISAKATNGQADPNFLYPMRPCVLETVGVNYSPNGSLSLHQETHGTTIIDLTLSFKETSYYTRESFDNVKEYGYDGFNTSDLTTGGVGITYGGLETQQPVTSPTITDMEAQATRYYANTGTN